MFELNNITNTSGSFSPSSSGGDLFGGGGPSVPAPPPGGPGHPLTYLFNQQPGFDVVISSPLDFNFSEVLSNVLEKRALFSFLVQALGAFNVSAKAPLQSDRFCLVNDPLPLAPVEIQVYMLRGFQSTDTTATSDRQSEIIDESLFTLSETSTGGTATAADTPVQFRPKKQRSDEALRRSANRLSMLSGVEPNHPLIQTLSMHIDVEEVDADDVVVDRVATFYGLPVDLVKQILQKGQTLRQTIIEHYGISQDDVHQALDELQWEGAQTSEAAPADPIPALMQQDFGLETEDEVKTFKAGLRELGLTVQDLSSIYDIVKDATCDNKDMLNLLCQKAITLFDEGNTSNFFNFIHRLHEFENKRREVIQHNRIEILRLQSLPEDDQAQLAELQKVNENLAFTFHTDVVVNLVSHILGKIQEGSSFIGHELFFNLISDPRYAQPFSRLEAKDIEYLTKKLPDALRTELGEKLKELGLKVRGEIDKAIQDLEETQKKELKQIKKKGDQEARKRLDQLRAQANAVDFEGQPLDSVPDYLYKRYAEFKSEKLQAIKPDDGEEEKQKILSEVKTIIADELYEYFCEKEDKRIEAGHKENEKYYAQRKEEHSKESHTLRKVKTREAQNKRWALVREYLAKAPPPQRKTKKK